MIKTYAFLDPGFNTPFCMDNLIERHCASKRKTALYLTTMYSDNVKSQCSVVNLEVCNLQGCTLLNCLTCFQGQSSQLQPVTHRSKVT